MIGPTDVRCGDCGLQLSEHPSTPVENRTKCPRCDSMRRHFLTDISTTAFADVSASFAKLSKPTKQLLAVFLFVWLVGLLRASQKQNDQPVQKKIVKPPGANLL